MRIEQVSEPVMAHGEGPVWSPGWGGLRCVDMLAGDVLQLGADGEFTRVHVGEVAAMVRPCRDGGVIVATRDEFLIGADVEHLSSFATLGLPADLRLNEGGCDPDGRLWCGSMAFDERPKAGSLYCLNADGEVSLAQQGIGISNGLDFTADGDRAYYVDTHTHRIDVFDYSAEAGLTNRRPWVTIDPGEGGPDGLTVDSEGGVWVALFGGGKVIRFDADGQRDMVVPIPASNVTACTFAGQDLQTLYITTSRLNLRDDEPAAGALFAVEPGITGLPVLEFAG